MKKLISILITLLITASIFILPMSVSAKDEDVITLRISNCEEYIDEGNWDKDDTIDLDSGDIIGKNSMIIDFENWYNENHGTPLSVLRNLRCHNMYKETEGDRLNIAWSAWMCSKNKYWRP